MNGDDVIRGLQGKFPAQSDDAIAAIAGKSAHLFGDAAGDYGLQGAALLDATCTVVGYAAVDSDVTEDIIVAWLMDWNDENDALGQDGLQRLGSELATAITGQEGGISTGLDVLDVGCDLASE